MKRNTDSEKPKNRMILRQKTEIWGKGLNSVEVWFFGLHPSAQYFVWKQRESICKIVLVCVPGNTDVAHEIRKSYSWKKLVL